MDYSHTQRAPLGTILYVAGVAIIALGLFVRDEPMVPYILGAAGAITVLTGLMFGRLTVRDEEEHLAVRFGPRLWLGHAAALEAPGATRQSDDVQVGLGLRVGVDLALAPGIDLLLEGEVGANLHGLELSGPAGRTGFLGAYWGLDVGLGFR